MDVYVNGEPAGTWETATGNTVNTYHEIDVTGIDDLDALEEYFNETGIMPYEMVNGKKVYVTFAKLPQNNTAVSVSAISDLVTIAGGSALAGYHTEGMIAKLAKSVVFNAIMRLMFVAIDADTVMDEIQAELESALNPFCIDGTNDIPIYVDSNGVAHVFADAVEAVRNRMIELGAYDAGAPTVTPDPEVTLDYTWMTPINVYNMADYNVIEHDVVEYPSSSDPQLEVIFRRFTFDNVTHTQPVYLVPLIYKAVNNLYYPAFMIISKATFSGTYNNYWLRKNGAETTQATRNISGVNNTTSHGLRCYYTYGFQTYDNYPVNQTPIGYSTSAEAIQAAGNSLNPIVVETDLTKAASDTYGKLASELLYIIETGTIHGGVGIAGMQAVEGMLEGFGDITMPLPDVWPDWYARKKQVATPADDDLLLRSPALPLDVPVDNVFDDGYAGDSEDATTGDLEDILKNIIVGVLPDIIADIIDNTDATPEDAYDIPVDDSGDTPPAEPPILNGSSNGLWTMYNPTKAQVNAFGAWLWADTLIDQIMRQFNSPIDAIIGFHQIYCTPTTGSDKVIKAGYLDSPVSAKEITDQYATIDCGSVFVDEFYGTALDYNHSHVSIYLPFVGIVPLETSVVTGATLQVIYRIDVFTGTCLAQIKVIKQNSNAVMYAFEGNCAVQIPLTATTYCGVVSSIINLTQSGLSLFMGDMMGAFRGAVATVGSGITNLTGTRQSGSMGSNAGALGIRKPYLIITRPIAYDAVEYSRQYGYPLNKTVTLGSLSGYTKVKDIHLSGIPCTDDELVMIEALLKEGVIIN